MIDKPIFAPSFHVEVVEPEGVFLLSERGHFVLKGQLHCRLATLMDGSRTAEEIVDKLSGAASAAEVYYALGLLESKSYVVDADSGVPHDRAAFWHTLGVDPGLAERRLNDVRVSIASFGNVPIGPFVSALAALDIRVDDGGDLTVVLTDDYLQPGLDDFNVGALTSRQPWLLVKPLGTVVWIGPAFDPGTTACWECLADRLRSNREVESYLQGKKSTMTPFPVSRAALPATVQVTLQLAALETAKAIARGPQQAPGSTLVTLDVLTLQTQGHTLVSRPQCPCCGVAARSTDRGPGPLTLQSQAKLFTLDGGHRAALPEQTFARYEHHISPITGAVSHLSRVPVNSYSLHVYVAGQNVATRPDSRRDNLHYLRHGLHSKSGGKGITDAQARASALCEALERYSGNFQGNEMRKLASCRRLDARAVHPNACMIISETQYERRHDWNVLASRFHCVPDPVDEDVEIEWTPVWSLTEEAFKYLPTAYCYYGYPSPAHAFYCWADSNGCAAGNTLEEAILHGFMELVERDGVCLWWYNRVQRPEVDLDTFAEPYIHELKKHYRTLNRDIWVLDLTSDLHIPTFAAISRRMDTASEEIIMGFGAHFDPRIGVLRALTELNQYFPLLRNDAGGDDMYAYADPDRRQWWQTATLAGHPYLAPDVSTPRIRADYDVTWSDDVREDVLRGKAIVERLGMEMLVLDQTRPDIGLPVVKVIVPGLRHFWVRLGPGRLYDVPVKLGWLNEPVSEDQLNPVPMFV